MTPTKTAAILRRYNEWRRGDEDIPQFDPRKLGEAIDAAVEMIDRLEAAEKARDFAKEEVERLLALAHDQNNELIRLREEGRTLRAKIEQIEQQEPVATVIKKGADRYWMIERLGEFHDGTYPLYAIPGAQPTQSVPDGFAWPECPKRRQSHVLFDDGYEEGWAACVATIKAALAAPEAKPCP